MKEPSLIQFDQIGKPENGFLSVAQYQENIPFDVKRIFWTYEVPDFMERGNHAYHTTQQVLVILHGAARITLESTNRKKQEFELYHPSTGLFVPPRFWRKVQFFDNAVLLALSSKEYEESDYIREYDVFKTLRKQENE